MVLGDILASDPEGPWAPVSPCGPTGPPVNAAIYGMLKTQLMAMQQ